MSINSIYLTINILYIYVSILFTDCFKVQLFADFQFLIDNFDLPVDLIQDLDYLLDNRIQISNSISYPSS
jgi:hypothetical protein